jgi:ketosteroid isomerase-like protein
VAQDAAAGGEETTKRAPQARVEVGVVVMRKCAVLPWLVLALASAIPARAEAARVDMDSLVAAERAFAALSVDKGMRDAFLAYLAGDAVIFRPRAVSARPVWEARGPVPATLAWQPAYAEVSAAGDLGYTTGPSEFRPYDAKEPVSYGHFVSIWQRQGDGAWRVALDVGISHERPAHGVGSRDFTPGPDHASAGRRAGAEPAAVDLQALDRQWSGDERALGAVPAFTRWAASDVRFYREGTEPVRGTRAASAALVAIPGANVWIPDSQRVARSADLGCTYGVLERRASPDGAPDSSVYLHVWRRDRHGHWQAALVLEKPLPKPAKP